MALRLTDAPPTPPTARPRTTPSHAAAPVGPRAARRARALAAERLAALPRALRRGRRRSRTSTAATRRAARCSRLGLQRAAGERPRIARAFAAVAGAAPSTLLEAEPREPVLLNYAGVAFYELGALKPPPSALFRAARRLDPSSRTSRATSPSSQRRKPRGRRRRRCPQAAGRVREPAPARRARRRRRAPGRGPDAQPVHDRQGRGGDARRAASPPRATPSTRSSSSTPARPTAPSRSRECFGAKRPAPRVDRRLRRRPQRLLRRRHRRLGHVPRRRRGPRRRRRRAPARAHRPHLARGVLPHRDQPHRRPRGRHRASPTTRCACSATAPSTASRAASTSRSPSTCPAYLPERQELTAVRVEHFGYLGAVRDAKDKSQPQHRAARAPGRRGRRHARSCTSTSAPSTPPLGDVAARADALRARLGAAARPARRQQRTATRRRWPRATSTRCASPAATPRSHRAGDEVLELFPGFTDIVLEQALAAGAAGDADREEALLRALPGDGRRAQPLLGHRGLRHLPRARGARRRACAGAAPSTRPRRRCARCLQRAPGLPGRRRPLRRRCCCAAASPAGRGRRDGPRARGRLDARACASCSPSR